jgi:hypothetical protein
VYLKALAIPVAALVLNAWLSVENDLDLLAKPVVANDVVSLGGLANQLQFRATHPTLLNASSTLTPCF